MSKLLLSIYVTLLVVLISCNSTEKKPDTPSPLKDSAYNFAFADTLFGKLTAPPQGVDVFYVKTDVAKAMVDSFKTSYRKQLSGEVTAFDTLYWIDACTIQSLNDYFDSNPVYDGLRIYFASDVADNGGIGGEFKRKTKVKLFATKLRTVLNDKVSKHFDADSGIVLRAGCNQSYFFGNKANANPEINSFDEYYHKSAKMKDGKKRILSKSVWIDATVVKFLGKLVTNNPSKVDGVNILTAAYRDKGEDQVAKYVLAKQSTILMVPSTKGSPTHISEWKILEAFFEYQKDKSDKGGLSFLGGFNKAELCPQVCN